ncbi:glutamine synthetase [Halopseudomonas laoshanensis]|jgi:glutamine synthetase|uniref:Glutamine synthetase n=1 Tax=Halopseudomonas laoshanensis TaxID=2268758 RepID=A0A7V7KVV3_9GAMM|nr:glutamine synthetase family protein [Halopseudomonas laoshanensis]KAA0694304.1 glutamine synthetase [Halopseudomonas laoshanensis]MBQ0743379.1 glutamine synthetase [Pseudomonas sp.]MBQ0777630.1 glutamine synthetase [Pseudomonas sp.]WOD11618.1 glutamine synthetase family protein [Pseudomonas sp. NyZ704]
MPSLTGADTAAAIAEPVSVQEAEAFLAEHPEIHFIDLLIADMNGIVRGKRIDRSALLKAYEKGIALPASIFALNIQGTTVEETGLGLEIGDADRVCLPIPGTLSVEPWQKRPTGQLLMTMYELDRKTPFFADPRYVLQRIVKRFSELGLTPVSAFELEFYLIDQENITGRPQPPRSPMSGKRPNSVQVYSMDDLDEYAEFLQDVIEAAHEQDIPADAIVAESAPGQFEVNLHHVDDPVVACDHNVLLKRVIKNVAYDHEMDTTFMAKPYYDQAGNGMHVHISLVDELGVNVFAPNADGTLSDTLRWAIGGLLQTLPEYMAFLCPNVNSYRRFSPSFFVPCAPTWGIDNRTVAVRVPGGDPESMRIEHRLAGADANPYLLMAALLSAIHYGISNKIEPPEMTEGNAYDQHEASLPTNLRDALRALENSAVMKEYIGEEYLDVFVLCKESEQEEFERTISDLEYMWYLHTV